MARRTATAGGLPPGTFRVAARRSAEPSTAAARHCGRWLARLAALLTPSCMKHPGCLRNHGLGRPLSASPACAAGCQTLSTLLYRQGAEGVFGMRRRVAGSAIPAREAASRTKETGYRHIMPASRLPAAPSDVCLLRTAISEETNRIRRDEQRRIGGRRQVVEKIIAQGISADSLPFRPAFDGSAWLSDGFIRRSLFLLQSQASSAI